MCDTGPTQHNMVLCSSKTMNLMKYQARVYPNGCTPIKRSAMKKFKNARSKKAYIKKIPSPPIELRQTEYGEAIFFSGRYFIEYLPTLEEGQV